MLLNGFKDNDSWSIFWLAETIQNIYGSKKLHEQIEYLTEFGLLKKCYLTDSKNQNVRLAFIDSIVKSFDYAIHEWPDGVIYAAYEEPEEFLLQIDYAKTLNIENNHSKFFLEVEEINKEDRARKT